MEERIVEIVLLLSLIITIASGNIPTLIIAATSFFGLQLFKFRKIVLK